MADSSLYIVLYHLMFPLYIRIALLHQHLVSLQNFWVSAVGRSRVRLMQVVIVFQELGDSETGTSHCARQVCFEV